MEDAQSDTVKLQEHLEYLFMRIIIAGLKDNSIPIPEARQAAKDFLAIEPFTSVDDARVKIDSYISTRPRFNLLKEYSDVYYDEERLEEKLEVMRKHLKENNIDEALKVIE